MEAGHVQTKTLIISFAIVVSIEWAMRLVVPKHVVYSVIGTGAARLFQVSLIVLFLVGRGQGISAIGLAPSKMAVGFRRGLFWSAGFGMVVLLAFAVLYTAGVNMTTLIRAHMPAKPGHIMLFLLVGGIIGPVAEEVFFRGILYGFFRRWGTLLAVALSTLLFVLAHPVSHGILLPQLVGGILFAVAYEIEGSLLTPITIHILGNLAIFTLSTIT